MDKQKIGNRGEQIAASYLQAEGYTLVARNWRCQFGEIDLIMQQNGMLVFVEVRTRRAQKLQTGEELAFASITPRKRQRLIKSVHGYLNKNDLEDIVWRVDVVAVVLIYDSDRHHVQHVEDALGW